jgi:hypothetical protein
MGNALVIGLIERVGRELAKDLRSVSAAPMEQTAAS